MQIRRMMMAGALVAAAWLPAGAADLGGNCCADLEERVAELEATVVRKGNRKVSVTLSGYVSHSVMWWDDGVQKDMYIGDGGGVSSRFRFLGEAKINPSLTAGFLYEFAATSNLLGSMNQTTGGDDLGGSVALRDSTAWLRHAQLGMVKIGHGSTASDNVILIDVSGAGVVMTPDVGVFSGSFFGRIDTATVNGVPIPGLAGTLAPVTWNALLNGGISFDTARRNHVLYETPSLAGFTASGAVAEANFWDVALRYAGELGGFRGAAGIGYSVDTEAPAFGPATLGLTAREVKELKGSLSVLHVSSGLFVNVAGGKREIDWSTPGFGGTITAKDPYFWHVSAGYSQNVFGLGKTVVYGEYLQAKDMLGAQLSGPVSGSLSSDARVWGAGVVQHVDAAAMELFLSYKNYSADVSASWSDPGSASLEFKDFQTIIAGTRISF